MKFLFITVLAFIAYGGLSQLPAGKVNVFLGTSGDHGQLSPAASSPFGMLSIAPQTYPNQHTGYEYRAKTFLGFTHNRFEGVGCTGSGGNIMITPWMGTPSSSVLIKQSEQAAPGRYSVSFTNGMNASFVVSGNSSMEGYQFPTGKPKGFVVDLAHTLSNRFVAEEHTVSTNSVNGWIDSKTTCNAGTYRVYYYLSIPPGLSIVDSGNHKLFLGANPLTTKVQMKIALSSVDVEHAKAAIPAISVAAMKTGGSNDWNAVLDGIKVKGDPKEEKLFYSLFYRTLQSPYLISEKDGTYRATDGSLQKTTTEVYNGWAIWDNYRTQLPLLELLYPDRYQSIVNSLVGLYKTGKKDYATQHEPSNTVRTEHAIVVLLDAYRKGYKVDFAGIRDSLVAEQSRLDFSHPDKALESSYDTWALSQIMEIIGDKGQTEHFREIASHWKVYWQKDFMDTGKPDVDKVGARGMYQGTVWQYRWLVPFDMKGLVAEAGGEQAYISQLDEFFTRDLYNHANETDIQVPLMYNITSQPWKSQDMVVKYAADTVVQYYFNDNSRGIDPFVDRVYRNAPDTYIRTMDDDAGAMSAWYVFAACGIMPACVGWPVYYLNVPLFDEVSIGNRARPFVIRVKNRSLAKRYIQSARLNGTPLTRNWLTHQEISNGGVLEITAGDQPSTTFGVNDRWISELK
ncbi:MAG: alpha-mannosidase [Chitinophagaceae bacterium]|nr:MAG: alpha-mannosidase [Chitinophagaceae bacterium]